MKKIITILAAAFLVFALSGTASAALSIIGQGTITSGGGGSGGAYKLIYDSDLDVTWLDYSNAVNDWSIQDAWAAGLVVTIGAQQLDNWSLPDVTQMGSLYYTGLGNPAGGPLTYTSPFVNLQADHYWTETAGAFPGYHYHFDFSTGYSGESPSSNKYALAVIEGNPVPVPAAAWLLGSGLLGLFGLRRKLFK